MAFLEGREAKGPGSGARLRQQHPSPNGDFAPFGKGSDGPATVGCLAHKVEVCHTISMCVFTDAQVSAHTHLHPQILRGSWVRTGPLFPERPCFSLTAGWQWAAWIGTPASLLLS